VTVATAERLDWLPVFKGVPIRNFITLEAINDRTSTSITPWTLGRRRADAGAR
jgi:hypothetical protein